jgi:hypothetical protein
VCVCVCVCVCECVFVCVCVCVCLCAFVYACGLRVMMLLHGYVFACKRGCVWVGVRRCSRMLICVCTCVLTPHCAHCGVCMGLGCRFAVLFLLSVPGGGVCPHAAQQHRGLTIRHHIVNRPFSPTRTAHARHDAATRSIDGSFSRGPPHPHFCRPIGVVARHRPGPGAASSVAGWCGVH